MITEQGIIERLSGSKAVVRIQKSSACAACQSRGSCMEASGGDMVVEIPNELGAEEGDFVEVSIPTGSFLTLSLLVYLFPVAALIFGAVAGGGLAQAIQMNGTVLSIAGGVIGIGIAFYVLKRFDRSARAQKDFQPRMTRILRRLEPDHREKTS